MRLIGLIGLKHVVGEFILGLLLYCNFDFEFLLVWLQCQLNR